MVEKWSLVGKVIGWEVNVSGEVAIFWDKLRMLKVAIFLDRGSIWDTSLNTSYSFRDVCTR